MKLKQTYILVGLAAMLYTTACSDKKTLTNQGPPPPTPVTVANVEKSDAVYYDEYPATLSAMNEIKLTAQVAGYITGVYFKDGQKVSKGQRLYSIDAQVYKANYQQAIANLQVQESNLVKSEKDAERYHELDKQDAVAKQQVDYADAALQVSKKQVSASKANVAAVQSSVKFSSISAPFTGTIGISQVKVGTSVVPGQTILNTISTDDPIAVDFTVDQKDIYRFEQLQQNNNSIKDSVFTIKFGNDVYPFPGVISLIDRAVDPQTGTIKTRLTFSNNKGMLKAGMNATIRVKNTGGQQALTIPYKAVTEQLGEYFVYVVNDSNKVSQHKVQLGKQIGASIIIQGGLKEGEKIVVQGVQNLHEGSLITTAAPHTTAPSKK